MAFSQSFEFGNSTFMNLEKEAKLHIIQESPPHQDKKNCFALNKSRTLIRTNKNSSGFINKTANSRKQFRKSKSDSTLPKFPESDKPKKEYSENYSDFFRSDFSLSDDTKKKLQDSIHDNISVLRVSQIEAAFNDSIESSERNGISVFEAPICSEDVRGLLDLESESVPVSSSNTPNKAILEVEDVPNLDSSCFLYPIRDINASAQLLKDINESRIEIKEVLHQNTPSNHDSLEASLSRMSPEQLKWSPIGQSERDNRNDEATLPPKIITDRKDEGKVFQENNNDAQKIISAWNLPLSVLKAYEMKGVKKMFDWQIECLRNPKVLFDYCNLVYSAPTSAGKTLVSEILLLKSVLERGKKVLLILPFISVVREKMFYLQDLLTAAGYRVEGFFGGYTPPGGFDSIHVAICTIEKANSIVNKLMEHGKIDEIGTVVVDEVHLISDPGRGYILELLIAKILYMSRKFGYQIQVITMSATLANVELLKRWLEAELYVTNFRPVALQEMIKIGNKIYDNKLKFLRDITQPAAEEENAFPALGNDSDHVAQLCIETLLEGCSVIVFCPSKDWCENLAMQLASAIHSLCKSGTSWGNRLREQIQREAVDGVKKQLSDIPTGLDAVLSKTISCACAFHHAGLTTEERDIVEASFKSGALKIIVATSTLSSGVNLPARRVIIRSPLFGGKQMSSLTYKQMIGRAGRTGKDILGESILICTDSNARTGRELITADIKPISSCLDMDSSTHLKRALLEVISSGVASTKADIERFVNCTLLSVQKQTTSKGSCEDDDEDENYINDALDFLIEYEFIRLQKNEGTAEENYVATRLGMACLASSMPPTDGLILFAELQKSRRCFVLESELHAVYLVTPYSVCYQLQDLDWLLFLDMWEKLSPAMKKVGELVGVKESFLVRAMRGQSKLDYKLMQIHKRFYTALALQELVNETPINVVAHKFKCTRGMLQSLQQMSSTFAGIVTAFCTSLQWSMLSLIVGQFKDRLYFGIHRDLIDLMRLPDMSHKRARTLFDAGITNLVELANSDVFRLEKVLYDSIGFDSAKQHENENAHEAKQRNSERNFFITGKAGMTVSEAAKLFIQEARQFVQYEIGVDNIKWTQEKVSEPSVTESQSDPQNVELHMSCEEIQIVSSKRKSNDKFYSPTKNQSPPKIRKLIQNQDVSSANLLEKQEKSSGTPSNKNSQYMEADNRTKKDTINGHKTITNKVNTEILKKEAAVIKNHALKTSSFEKNPQNITEIKIVPSANMTPNKTLETTDSTKRILKSVKQIKSSIDNPNLDRVKDSNFVKETITTAKSVIKENKPQKDSNLQIKTDTNRTNKLQGEDQPTTSATSRKLLLKKQIEERRLEALKRINERKNQVQSPTVNGSSEIVSSHSAPNKENEIDGQTPTHFKSPMDPNKHVNVARVLKKDQQNKSTPENISNGNCENDKDTPKSRTPTTMPNKPTLLRRSPRNQQTTIGSANKTKNADVDLFLDNDNDSFLLNSGVTTALTDAKERSKFKPTGKSTMIEIQLKDEIPNSQQLVLEEEKQCTTPHTPQTSRFLRSFHHRTQRACSPKLEKTKKKESPKKSIPTVNEPTSSTSLELSDISMENSLMKNPMHLNASHILSCSKVDTDASSFKTIEILDICGNEQLFKAAIKELIEAKRFGFSVGLQQQAAKRKPIIGANLLINQVGAADAHESDKLKSYQFHIDDSTYLDGVAFSIADNVVFYMNMQDLEDNEIGQKNKPVKKEPKIKYLRILLQSQEHTLLMHEAKEQLKILYQAIPDLGTIKSKLEDPKVANWLLQPDKVSHFYSMCQQFAPECMGIVNLCGSGRGYSSYGLDANSAIVAKLRCSIEACVTVHILKGQIENLERIGTGQLHKFFNDLEMPIQLSLCEMEIIGFPVREDKLQTLFQKMVDTMKKLENKIYEMHGSRFNLGSSTAVAKVVGLHRKTNGRVSTSRQILEKIDSPISQLIINYRKLSVTLTKNIQPLLRSIQQNRIHGQSLTLSATGRISMSEPNLQNVAKDFEIIMGSEKIVISCRSAFAPVDENRCLISSDFCQLEMRILAHLSQDAALLQVMKSERDLFTAIAARWNKINEETVSEQLRNGTKQICYGIVYGMGIRSLADALKCTEQEAKLVSEQFHAVYPGIRTYIEKVVKFARNKGYVETITGRRRYLDHINSDESQMKSQAERQAVNSTIQGSAADIAKSAILRMEKNISKYKDKLGIEVGAVRMVLHLHDELIFEVPTDKAKKIAKVLSLTMESCVKLNVPLKVKLKMGRSWGELKEIRV